VPCGAEGGVSRAVEKGPDRQREWQGTSHENMRRMPNLWDLSQKSGDFMGVQQSKSGDFMGLNGFMI
jgi:hypothetical protein